MECKSAEQNVTEDINQIINLTIVECKFNFGFILGGNNANNKSNHSGM